jgi:hypothetical protein
MTWPQNNVPLQLPVHRLNYLYIAEVKVDNTVEKKGSTSGTSESSRDQFTAVG